MSIFHCELLGDAVTALAPCCAATCSEIVVLICYRMCERQGLRSVHAARLHAQQIAAHESPRTTKLYDRTSDQITLDEIERIAI